MTPAEYRHWRLAGSVYPGQGGFEGIIYCALALANEAGEAAGGIKKVWRDDGGIINEQKRLKTALELGDTLWYLDAFANELGYTLEDIMQLNREKIDGRKLQNQG